MASRVWIGESVYGRRMSGIHNERVKLTANWLNIMAAGTIIAGSITPLVTIAYGLRSGEPLATGTVILLTLVWISAGVALHWMAWRVLGRLQDDGA